MVRPLRVSQPADAGQIRKLEGACAAASPPRSRARSAWRLGSAHGWAGDSGKVSAFAYVPVRSGSLAFTSCVNSSVTASLDIGALHVSRFSGEAEDPMALNAVPVLDALRARACSGWASTNEPLTRWPVPVEDGSATLSSASPAVEITLAVVEAR